MEWKISEINFITICAALFTIIDLSPVGLFDIIISNIYIIIKTINPTPPFLFHYHVLHITFITNTLFITKQLSISKASSVLGLLISFTGVVSDTYGKQPVGMQIGANVSLPHKTIVITDSVAFQCYINRGSQPGTSNLISTKYYPAEEPVINKYAEMISLEPAELNSYSLYKFIDDWYGTSYRFGGTDNTGIDCSAFSQKLYGNVYNTAILRTSHQQHRNCERIDEEEAAEGDLVFFRMHHWRVSHVGVYLANGYFVHASRSHGVTISSLNDRYWHRRLAGYGRMERPEPENTESGAMQ